ncbi:hypothetical protein [Streptomyces sp. NPDC002763]|uniref:hypothetical protein n=1 Tax=Streptomyces sp. NPDC002763 TaxID=3154427 RepID=UPI0033267995
MLAAGLTAQALAAPRTDTDQTLSPNGSQDLADLVTDFMTLRPLLTVPQPAPSGPVVPDGRADGRDDEWS